MIKMTATVMAGNCVARATTRAAVVSMALLALTACAPVADMSAPAQGMQTAPSQPTVSISGSARVGVTRTLN